MTGPTESAGNASESNRPKDPTQLLVRRDIKTLWQARNIRANRFSVLNLELVIGKIGLEHTKCQEIFLESDRGDRSGWMEQIATVRI